MMRPSLRSWTRLGGIAILLAVTLSSTANAFFPPIPPGGVRGEVIPPEPETPPTPPPDPVIPTPPVDPFPPTPDPEPPVEPPCYCPPPVDVKNTPEPATLVLGGLGILFGSGYALRRKLKK